MIQTLIWAGVVLVLGGIAIWRACYYADVYMGARLAAQKVETSEDETMMMERRTAAEIASRTLEQAAALKQAELEHKTAKARAATALIDELKPDRLAAERAIIAARVAAEEKLAPEFVREANKGAEGDVIDMYSRYMKTCKANSVYSPLELTKFVDMLKSRSLL